MITLKVINKKEPLKAKFGIKFPDIVPSRLQEKTIEPTKEVQEVVYDKNYDGLSKVTVEAIPEEYIIPEGMLPITENKTYDVTNYARVSASVHPAPNLQNKDIEITENGSQTITADEGYDGLGNVNITTNAIEDLESELTEQNNSLQTQTTTIDDIVKALKGKASGGGEIEEEPDYIKDGLIAWFDCKDEMTEDGKLMSRVGDDYINGTRPVSGNNIVNNPFRHYKGSPLINNMSYAFGTGKDYFQNGYTFEVAGLVYSQYNANGSTGGWLMCSNCQGAWGVGVTNEQFYGGGLTFLNGSYPTYSQSYTGYFNKRFGVSLYTEEVFSRSSPTGAVRLQASVDGGPYITIQEKSSTSRNSNSWNKMAIMCYYADSGNTYAINGELYCVRIYNRKLTNEEIAHNHEIDKKRFKLHDYVEESE